MNDLAAQQCRERKKKRGVRALLCVLCVLCGENSEETPTRSLAALRLPALGPSVRLLTKQGRWGRQRE